MTCVPLTIDELDKVGREHAVETAWRRANPPAVVNLLDVGDEIIGIERYLVVLACNTRKQTLVCRAGGIDCLRSNSPGELNYFTIAFCTVNLHEHAYLLGSRKAREPPGLGQQRWRVVAPAALARALAELALVPEQVLVVVSQVLVLACSLLIGLT